MAARYKEDGYFRDYSSLSLQRDLVEKKFVSTVAKVYAALTKAQKLTKLTLGSCRTPEIVVLGCGSAPEMVAVKVQLAVHSYAC